MRPALGCGVGTEQWTTGGGPALTALALGLWGELLEVREPRKWLANWHGPCVLSGRSLKDSRSQRGLAQCIHRVS